MASISGWTEGILLSLVALGVIGLMVAGFNGMYGKDYVVPISDNQTENLFITYQSTAQTQVQGGDVQFNAVEGITLKQSYGLAKDAISIVWSFVSGGWIERTAQLWGAGEAGMMLARGLRIIYFLSVVFGLLYALFKVVF